MALLLDIIRWSGLIVSIDEQCICLYMTKTILSTSKALGLFIIENSDYTNLITHSLVIMRGKSTHYNHIKVCACECSFIIWLTGQVGAVK